MSSNLIGSSFPIAPSPVKGVPFTGVVARITDADKNTDPGQYAASIQWGDGKASRGIITADPSGGFDVSGTHTFANAGPFRITAQVGDTDGDVVSVSTTNIVAQAPITAAGVAVHPTRGGVVSRVTVASFVDPDSSLKPSSFSATIDWGDGTVSKGTIVAARAKHSFKVLGSHTYKKSGTFSVSTAIQQGSAVVSSSFTATNLISDGAVAADHIDPSFVNPWGLVAPNPGAFWDSNNGTGTSTVFSAPGNVSMALPVVTVPPPAGSTDSSTPTGIVNNQSKGFVVSDGTTSGPAAFIYSTEDGTIAGWNPRVATNGSSPPSVHAVLAVDNSGSGAVYKGLTILNVPAGSSLAAGQYLFATNFHSGALDAFDSAFKPVTLPAGAFEDATIPAGYAPFGIQAIGGDLYVTYAKQNSEKHDDVAGAGNGFVDVYSASGLLLMRLGGTTRQAELNSPWGLIQAPSAFGRFSNDLLVGNFGDSHVSAFDPVTGAFLGQLTNSQERPLTLDGGFSGPDSKGLWGLFDFGSGTGSPSTVYFNSGFNDEGDGVFGTLTPTEVATATADTRVSVVLKRGR
jgi:uncharacterized protein (TIGR03118 family)